MLCGTPSPYQEGKYVDAAVGQSLLHIVDIPEVLDGSHVVSVSDFIHGNSTASRILHATYANESVRATFLEPPGGLDENRTPSIRESGQHEEDGAIGHRHGLEGREIHTRAGGRDDLRLIVHDAQIEQIGSIIGILHEHMIMMSAGAAEHAGRQRPADSGVREHLAESGHHRSRWNLFRSGRPSAVDVGLDGVGEKTIGLDIPEMSTDSLEKQEITHRLDPIAFEVERSPLDTKFLHGPRYAVILIGSSGDHFMTTLDHRPQQWGSKRNNVGAGLP